MKKILLVSQVVWAFLLFLSYWNGPSGSSDAAGGGMASGLYFLRLWACLIIQGILVNITWIYVLNQWKVSNLYIVLGVLLVNSTLIIWSINYELFPSYTHFILALLLTLSGPAILLRMLWI